MRWGPVSCRSCSPPPPLGPMFVLIAPSWGPVPSTCSVSASQVSWSVSRFKPRPISDHPSPHSLSPEGLWHRSPISLNSPGPVALVPPCPHPAVLAPSLRGPGSAGHSKSSRRGSIGMPDPLALPLHKHREMLPTCVPDRSGSPCRRMPSKRLNELLKVNTPY